MKSPVWAGDWPITQPWGPTTLTVEPLYATPLGEVHWHCGVDVGMPVGTALYAARAGVVTRLGYGILGITSGRETHYYIHIDKAVVQLGVAVATGQLIAYSGRKVPQGGYLTGPHLHFERNAAGLNVPPGLDPLPLIEGAYGAGSASLGLHMDADVHAAFVALQAEHDNIRQHQVADRDAILAQVQALQTAVAALKVAGASGDSAAILSAIAATQEALGGISKDLAAARLLIDKIDRGE